MTFTKWLDTFVSEKKLNTDYTFEVEGPNWGWTYIPLAALIEEIKAAPKHEQAGIKHMLIKIDFVNGDVMDYFKHLAQEIAL